MAAMNTSAAHAGARWLDLAQDHPATLLWTDPHSGVLARMDAAMQARNAHPARTLVLLPYAQLLGQARQLWAQQRPDGFSPRFETTRSWCEALATFSPGGHDVRFDAGLDGLTARALLRQAGLAAQAEPLASVLLETATTLAPWSAAQPPHARQVCADAARSALATGMDTQRLAWELQITQVALAWVGTCAYASDVLFAPARLQEWDCVIAVQGVSPDPLTQALASLWGERWVDVPIAEAAGAAPPPRNCSVHACADFHEEAERSAACVLDHIAAGRTPVALVSADRALTRRVRAVLHSRGVQMRDETGWKLSTSQAGAALMALVTACAWSASSDAVLAWLKLAPVFAPSVPALEACLRRDQTRTWRDAGRGAGLRREADLQALVQRINRVRAHLPGSARFSQWLAALRDALQDSGMWDGLVADSAGLLVLQALCLRDTPGQAPALESLGDAPWAQTPLGLADFSTWVQASLEGRNFTPPYPDHEELVILPLNQTLGRPFAAVVLVGCDADNLPLAADVPGILTPRQRADMGLPQREDLEQATRLAWEQALRQPLTAIFWRKSSGSGEPQLPSPLVQLLLLDGGPGMGAGTDHRTRVTYPVRLAAQPQPLAPQLPLARLSQGAYEDLRNCPYRFFALRQLGLQAREELEVDLGKRAFGLWLHEVLSRFHQAQGPEQPAALLPPPQRSAQLDILADAVAQEQGLGDAEFLPFRAGWPLLRDAYLAWLEGHENLADFEQAEASREQPLGPLVLQGRLDRIDRLRRGAALVLDYKTESLETTKARTKNPLEDTQMAFYAALLGEEAVEGMYLNLSERGEVTQVEPKDLALSRAALLQGIKDDMARIAAGAALPALGEGAACDYCAARGLCRKDFWAVA